MDVDRGFRRETIVTCLVDISSGVAGEITCIECGGDGDWTKFHPEPETLTAPMRCIECKGTGRIYVSI